MKTKRTNWQTFLQEIKRRKVVQVIIGYVAFAWLVIQVADVLADTFDTPNWVLKALFLALIVGLPVAAILAWIFDITQRGIVKTKELPHPSLLDVQSIPIIFHASIDNTLGPQQRKDRFRDYVLWAEDFNAQEDKTYDNDFMVLFENSIDALRYAIRIQNHSQQLNLPLKIAVIEAREETSQQDEANEIARARALAIDSQPGAIVTTKTVKQAIKNRGIKVVEKALKPLAEAQSKIEQKEFIIDPDNIHEVNQVLKDYSETVLYPTTPTSLKLASLVFLIVIAAGLWRFIPTIETKESATIAVLPFKNSSSSQEHEDFVSGLSEDIFNNITKIPNLKVTSRRSSQALYNNKMTIQEIGETLNADWIVEGSINRTDDKIRVSMWITDSQSGVEQWNEIFNLSSSDLLVGNRQILTSLSDFLDKPIDALAVTKVSDNPNKDLYPQFLKAKGLLKKPPTMERLKETESIFKSILSVQKNFSPASAGLCRTYYLMYRLQYEPEQFEQAEKHCSNVYKKEEANIDILIALSLLHTKKGNFQEANKFINIAESINPSDVELIFSKAKLQKAQSKHDDAIALLEQAIELEPGYWRLSQELGHSFLISGQWEKAVKYFQRVVGLVPNDPHGYDNLGTTFFFMGEFDKAAVAYEQSLAIKRNEVALSNTATMWFYHGNYKKAANYYMQAVQLTPHDYRLWLNLGDAESQSTELKSEAFAHYRHALDLALQIITVNPNNTEARMYSAWCYAQIGVSKEAITQAESALSISSNDPNILFMAAKVFSQLGEKEKAQNLLDKSIELGFPRSIINASPYMQASKLAYN